MNKFQELIKQRLEAGDVYLVFGRYNVFSAKCSTRISRGEEPSSVFQLSLHITLALSESCSHRNSEQEAVDWYHMQKFHQDVDCQQKNIEEHKLAITGQEEIPVEIGPEEIPGEISPGGLVTQINKS